LLVFEFGLVWPADWSSGVFTACPATIVLGGIINPGDGASFSFSDCQISQGYAGANRPAFWTHCWLWLTPQSDGEIEIWPRQESGDLCIVDCHESPVPREKHNPMTIYNAGVNVDPYEGLPPHATEPTTWGAIKAIFK
jgi:hypothetical protein